jgi:hypothetical protein
MLNEFQNLCAFVARAEARPAYKRLRGSTGGSHREFVDQLSLSADYTDP